jgi:hypothetical protein
MLVRILFATLMLCLIGVSSSWGGSVVIDGVGSDYAIQSKSVKNLFTNNGGVSDSKLAKLHQQLKSDGINTNGRVTFVLTTSSSHGLSLVSLVDTQKSDPSGPSDLSSLEMSSFADGDDIDSAQTDSGELNIDGNADGVNAFGDFEWNNNGEGDAFAWTGLEHMDNGTFSFSVNDNDPSTFPGLKQLKTFQFVTWTGSEWKVVKFGNFNNNGSFSFSFAVAPIPPAAVLGFAGLAAMMVARRRAIR